MGFGLGLFILEHLRATGSPRKSSMQRSFPFKLSLSFLLDVSQVLYWLVPNYMSRYLRNSRSLQLQFHISDIEASPHTINNDRNLWIVLDPLGRSRGITYRLCWRFYQTLVIPHISSFSLSCLLRDVEEMSPACKGITLQPADHLKRHIFAVYASSACCHYPQLML
jgi:hypothetical protein